MRCIGREGMIAGYKLVELGPTWKASTTRSRFQNQTILNYRLGRASCLLLKKEHRASLFFSAKSASGR